MSIAGFPTSSDIYLEVDGTKVAVVQSYSARSDKTSRAVEAFGEEEPVATIPGQTSHVLELSRLYATEGGGTGRHRFLRPVRLLSGYL